MIKRLCTGKISKASVTKTAVQYEGSLGVDASILQAAGILPYEMVLVANVTNARRFETYTISEQAGSGQICLYGGAAHMGKPGDELIIMAYGYMTPDEAASFTGPKVVKLGPGNKIQ